MKEKLSTYRLTSQLLIFIIPLLFLSVACDDIFKPEKEKKNEYLTKYEMIASYLPGGIKKFIELQEGSDYDLHNIVEDIYYGVLVYKIEYNTIFRGENIVASGLVAIPAHPGPFPVISYQNGTNTLHENAPSANPNFELYLMLEALASTGFVIVLPDYIGFGASKQLFHPYLHKESTVQAVTDMLEAVRELSEMTTFTLNNDLYITGYSQGGWATMQLQKAIESGKNAGFNLKASVPSAGPYDLTYINNLILESSTYPMPYFTAYIIDSYIKLGSIQTPIDMIYNSPYSERISSLFDGTKSGETINNQLTTAVNDLFTAQYINGHKSDEAFSSVRTALKENSIAPWSITTQTRIIHGDADTYVPFAVAENFKDALKGTVSEDNVELITLKGMDHQDGIIPAGINAISWFISLNKGETAQTE